MFKKLFEYFLILLRIIFSDGIFFATIVYEIVFSKFIKGVL